MFPLYATGVINTGGKFAAGVVDTGGKFATGINNTSSIGGKFAAGVVDTGGAPWLANISANFWKIWNDPIAILRGLGEDDSRKKSEVKNLVTLSL